MSGDGAGGSLLKTCINRQWDLDDEAGYCFIIICTVCFYSPYISVITFYLPTQSSECSVATVLHQETTVNTHMCHALFDMPNVSTNA